MAVDIWRMDFNAAEISLKLKVIADPPFFKWNGMLFFGHALGIICGIERTDRDNSTEVINVVDHVARNPA